MPDVVGKVFEYASFRNIFIVVAIATVILLLYNTGSYAVTQSQFNLMSMGFLGGSLVFWLVMAKNAKKVIFRDAVAGGVMGSPAVDAQLDGRKRYTMFEKDMILWQWENEPTAIHAAQVLVVTLAKMTSHDMTEMDLKRMTGTYESIMNMGDVEIITVHSRKKVAVKDWVSQMERKRDNLDFDAQIGGRATHAERAAAMTSTLQRLKTGLENAYDSRFFIIISTTGQTEERVKEKLRVAVNAMIGGFRDDLKLEVSVVKEDKLLDAAEFFRVYTALGPPLGHVNPFKPFRNLSLDMNWHNPFAVPRLPPLSKLIKGIYIGHVQTTNQPVHWDPDDPEMGSPHVLGIGPTGSGKTTSARTFMARALQVGIAYWVIDPAGDYTEFTRRLGGNVIDFEKETLNPFVLYGRNPVTVAKTVTDMLTLIAGLRGPERFFFQEFVLELYGETGIDVAKKETWTDEASNEVNFAVLYQKLARKVERTELSSSDMIIAKGVLHKISDLSVGQFALRKQNLNLDKLFQEKKSICFYVQEKLGENLRRALAWTLILQLRALAFTRYDISEELRLLVLIDEAHHFVKAMISPELPGGRIDTPITAFIREMRKKGVSLWLLSQSPDDFLNPGERTSPIFLNVGTTLMLGKADQAYMEFVTRYMGLSDEDAWGPNGLYWMTHHGQGILRKANHPHPIPIQIDAEPEALTRKEAE